MKTMHVRTSGELFWCDTGMELPSDQNFELLPLDQIVLTHPRTGFIFRRIKSLFHHSNWQHIFLISFNGTSKRGVMHYK